MNLKPEQIPDEVVEAAVAAWLEHPDVGSVQSMYSGMAYALAAALPVLLEQKGWWCQTSHGVVVSKTKIHGGCEPLFRFITLPTQDTPNEQ